MTILINLQFPTTISNETINQVLKIGLQTAEILMFETVKTLVEYRVTKRPCCDSFCHKILSHLKYDYIE